jgi:putative redox protein
VKLEELMIASMTEFPRYRTRFSDGMHDGIADVTVGKGGEFGGFRPHDLLEAALATCVNITVRMYADNHNMPLVGVTTRVELDRSQPEQAKFRYTVELVGDLGAEEREKLFEAANACPVRRTLSRTMAFESAFAGKTS